MSQDQKYEAIKQIDRRYWLAKHELHHTNKVIQSTPYMDEKVRTELRRSKVANQMRIQECEAWLRNEYLTTEQLKQLIEPYGII